MSGRVATYAITIELLDELTTLGFANAAYRLLREKTLDDTINAHVNYAKKHVDMEPDGQSARIQRRLQLIRDAYVRGGFDAGSSGGACQPLANFGLVGALTKT